MPSGRSKEDTWTTEELQKSLKDSKDERRRTKDKDRDRERHKDRDRDRDKEHRKKDKDEDRKERRHKDKENGHREEKSRSKRDEDDDSREHRRHRRHREEDEDGEERRHRRHDRNRDHDDEDADRDHRRRRHREHYDDGEGSGLDKDRDREKRRERRHRDEDEDKRKERKSKSRDEGYYQNWENEDDYSYRNRKNDKSERKPRDKDGRHPRDDKERSSKHRDGDDDREQRRHKDRDGDRHKDRDRHKKSDKDRDDKEERRRHRDRDGDDERRRNGDKGKDEAEDEERRRRKEKRERRKREEEEEKKRQEQEKKKNKPASASLTPASKPEYSSTQEFPVVELDNDEYESDFEPSHEFDLDEVPSHPQATNSVPLDKNGASSEVVSKKSSKVNRKRSNRRSDSTVWNSSESVITRSSTARGTANSSMRKSDCFTAKLTEASTWVSTGSSDEVLLKMGGSSNSKTDAVQFLDERKALATVSDTNINDLTERVKSDQAEAQVERGPDTPKKLTKKRSKIHVSIHGIVQSNDDDFEGVTLSSGEKIASMKSILPKTKVSKTSLKRLEWKRSKAKVRYTIHVPGTSSVGLFNDGLKSEGKKDDESVEPSVTTATSGHPNNASEVHADVKSDKMEVDLAKFPSKKAGVLQENVNSPSEVVSAPGRTRKNEESRQKSVNKASKKDSQSLVPNESPRDVRSKNIAAAKPQRTKRKGKNTTKKDVLVVPQKTKPTTTVFKRKVETQVPSQKRSKEDDLKGQSAHCKHKTGGKGFGNSEKSTEAKRVENSKQIEENKDQGGMTPQVLEIEDVQKEILEIQEVRDEILEILPKWKPAVGSSPESLMKPSAVSKEEIPKSKVKSTSAAHESATKQTSKKAKKLRRRTMSGASLASFKSSHDLLRASEERHEEPKELSGVENDDPDALNNQVKVTVNMAGKVESHLRSNLEPKKHVTSELDLNRAQTPWIPKVKPESSEESLCPTKINSVTTVHSAQDPDDYNYDDEEFEDYDDDFEDDKDDDEDEDDSDSNRGNNDDDSSSYSSSQKQKNKSEGRFDEDVDDIMDAMNRENERLVQESKRNSYRHEDEPKERTRARPSSSKQTFINFVSAKQRQVSSKASSKTARRGQELLKMIELDVTAYDMFDMPPMTEYGMYMRSFGSSNTKQAFVQTNDDNIERELQTDEIESAEKWCQHPPSDILSSGGPDDEASSKDSEAFQAVDSAHLSQFLEKAGQVINVLMEEEFLDDLGQDRSACKQSNIIISDAFTELTVPRFLRDRPVISSHISPVQSHMLITVHSTPDQPSSDMLTRQGCVCVWNVNEPSRPQKILMCESRPQCCCFSPTKTSLVFAGMHDGVVVVWDVREQSSMHRTHKHGKTDWVLRYPTYNTAGVLAYENHQSGIVSLQPIVAAGESESASLSGLSQSDVGEGLSFQLASLEEHGVIQLWVVAELSHPDPAGSESDFGLSPGGKVKLIKSSTIELESPLRDTRLRTTMKCADLQLLPTNNSHYYVATDTGCVLHGLRYGGKAFPRAFRPTVDNPVQVTSIDFSPFSQPIFLVGCSDGSLRLHHADNESPLVSWPLSTGGCPIQQVAWCRSRPSVFFVLDTAATMYIWDLLMDDSTPVKQEQIAQARVTSLSLSNDHSATGLGLPGRRPQIIVCLENGACEVHTVSQQFSALMPDELDQFDAYLQRNG